MEPRTITVVETSTQTTKNFQSSATTLAELKADFRSNGINYNGMAIYEGLSKTELKRDDQLLPHDVPYKGNTTNNLVFRLTKSEKNIRSGAMDRKEAMAMVKKLGIAGAINKKYGKNFTQCKTVDLIAEVEKAQKKDAAPKTEAKPAEKPAPKKEETQNAAPAKPAKPVEGGAVVEAIASLTNALVVNGTISEAEGGKVAAILGVQLEGAPAGTYSQAELAAILG